jgi:putative spermidine/putrescine transport system ATP-binding protein
MSTANDILVRFENVQKSYDGEILVVKDFNLDMERGEFLTMLGPSGSGKTTCLMMLAGFEPATHGEIYLSGKPINRVPPHKRGIGMVFQNYALFPHMTVGENLAFPLEVRGMDKTEREAKVTKALDMVQLGQFANRRPGQLSGGQAQRVAVARALLYVTHDQSEALTMSNRVAVFDDGVVQQLAPPDELYEQPTNAFVADFIGDNNRILGTVTSANGETCQVKTDDGAEITAKQVNIAGEGKRATLSLRPERIEVNPEPGKYENNVSAKALELIYLGDHIRTRMQACGREDFVVKIPNSTAHAQLSEGDTVNVGWAAEDCRALDPTD